MNVLVNTFDTAPIEPPAAAIAIAKTRPPAAVQAASRTRWRPASARDTESRTAAPKPAASTAPVSTQPLHVAAWSDTTPPASAASASRLSARRASSASTAAQTAHSGSTTFHTSLSPPMLRWRKSAFTPIAIAAMRPASGPASRHPMPTAGGTPSSPTTTGTQYAVTVSGMPGKSRSRTRCSATMAVTWNERW